MGMQLLSDYQFKKGVWQGEIYDPGSGKYLFLNYENFSQRRTANARLHWYCVIGANGYLPTLRPLRRTRTGGWRTVCFGDCLSFRIREQGRINPHIETIQFQ